MLLQQRFEVKLSATCIDVVSHKDTKAEPTLRALIMALFTVASDNRVRSHGVCSHLCPAAFFQYAALWDAGRI